MRFLPILLVLLSSLVYVGWHIWAIAPLPVWGKWTLVGVAIVLFSLEFVGFTPLMNRMPLWMSSFVYNVGNKSVIVLFYLLMAFVVLDLGRLVHIVPRSLLHESLPATAVLTVLIHPDTQELYSPGIYGLMNIASVREFSGMGMFLSFACALLFALALTKRGPITDRGYVSAALVLCIGLPLILPQMNARGLYLAGLLSLTLVQDWKGALVALILETVSLCGYMAAIFNNTILPLTVLSLMGIGLMLAAVVLFLDETQKVSAHGQD